MLPLLSICRQEGSLAALLLTTLCLTHLAQADHNNDPYLTFTLSPDSQDTCATNGSSDGLSVWLAEVPAVFTCFNMKDAFVTNSSTNYRNLSSHFIGSFTSDIGFVWHTYNRMAYNSQTNYSHIWYRQPKSSDLAQKPPGNVALRVLTFYDGKDCQTRNNSFVGASCHSDNDGECHHLPFGVASFALNSAESLDYTFEGKKGKCWGFTNTNDGSMIRSGSLTMVGLAMGVVVLGIFVS